jgi:hypothetical protein
MGSAPHPDPSLEDLPGRPPRGVPRTSPTSKGRASLRSVAVRPLAARREPRSGQRPPDREDLHRFHNGPTPTPERPTRSAVPSKRTWWHY